MPVAASASVRTLATRPSTALSLATAAIPPLELDTGRNEDLCGFTFISECGDERTQNIHTVVGANDGQFIRGRDGKRCTDEERNYRTDELM